MTRVSWLVGSTEVEEFFFISTVFVLNEQRLSDREVYCVCKWEGVREKEKGRRWVGRRNDVHASGHAWGKGNWVDFWGSSVFWTNGPFEQ